MAADREVSSGWQKQYHEAPKLWTAEQYAFGASGCMRTAQIIKHFATWPKYRPDEDEDFEKFLVKSIVPAVRAAASGAGVMRSDSGVETLPTTLLLATGARLAEISGNGCVLVENSGRSAIGSGYAEALGRLGTVGPWTEADVVDAARRAIATARGCGGPIAVVNTNDMTIREIES